MYTLLSRTAALLRAASILRARRLPARRLPVRPFSPPSYGLPPSTAALCLAASFGTVALCESREWSNGTLTWGQVVHRLEAGGWGVQHFGPLADTADFKSARHVLELHAAPGADLHAVLVALVAAFCEDGAKAVHIAAEDAPSTTTLTIDAGELDVEISVPRFGPFQTRVSVAFAGTAEPTFSEKQVRALERAARVCSDGDALRNQHAIFDEHGKHIACRNPRHPKYAEHAEDPMGGAVQEGVRRGMNEEEVGAKAREKLAELGIEVLDPEKGALTWEALAGYDVVKRRIEDSLVLPLRNPDVYESVVRGTRERFESNLPKAVLYAGPPGCGKTMSAKILASSIGVPFVHVPLESLLSKFYGETTKRLAAVLQAANELGRCLVFFDEIDSLANSRSGGAEVHEVTRRTLSVLLRFIDGIDGPQNAILLAATNHADGIDPALLSRFDVVVEFPLPDEKTREMVIGLYAKQLAEKERSLLARITDGFSGRELLDACEEAERTHAGRIVRGSSDGGADDALPRLQDYIDAVQAKSPMSVSAVEARNKRKNIGSRRFGPPPISA